MWELFFKMLDQFSSKNITTELVWKFIEFTIFFTRYKEYCLKPYTEADISDYQKKHLAEVAAIRAGDGIIYKNGEWVQEVKYRYIDESNDGFRRDYHYTEVIYKPLTESQHQLVSEIYNHLLKEWLYVGRYESAQQRIDNEVVKTLMYLEDTLEKELNAFLNKLEGVNLEHLKIYKDVSRLLNLLDYTRDTEDYFGRKSVSYWCKKATELVNLEKERLAKIAEKAKKTTWFKYQVVYNSFEVSSEEEEDQIIEKVIGEALGISIDDLDDKWVFSDDSRKCKVTFGDNHAFTITIERLGDIPLGSMGKRRLRLERVED
jgi:hypothetical protein